IVTKTRAVRSSRIEDADIDAVEAALEESFRRLRRASVYAVLVHDAGDLLVPGADRLWKLLERYRAAGSIGRIGVSVYNPGQCEAIAAAFPVEVVQLPFNVYDQRFLESGVLADLKARGVEVHARSAFLQGLLLMPPDALPPHFDTIRDHHTRFHAFAHAHGLSPLAAALTFCLSQADIDHVVVGCEKVGQIEEILTAAAAEPPLVFPESFALTDVNIIEPSRWPK
ncbi:MAG: aldo/keto reductase, partial [Rhodospirillaceae bacterium]